MAMRRGFSALNLSSVAIIGNPPAETRSTIAEHGMIRATKRGKM
jgi:hypothetical protein